MVVVYVLLCEGDRYYIGKTERLLKSRIEEHFRDHGSEWTRRYRPVRVVETKKDADEFDEDKFTKMYMKIHGVDRVRGGSYSQMVLPSYSIQALQKELCNASDLCFRCGRSGHFAADCYASTMADGSPIRHEGEKDDYSQSRTTRKKKTRTSDASETILNVLSGIAEALLETEEKRAPPPARRAKAERAAGPTCYRCGRRGHYAPDCYASRHVNGKKLY